MVVAIIMGLMQLALSLYARNVIIDAAGQGAHRAALLSSTPREGEERIRDIISHSVPGVHLNSVAIEEVEGPRTLMRASVYAALPLIGPWGIPNTLHAYGHAIVEGSQ